MKRRLPYYQLFLNAYASCEVWCLTLAKVQVICEGLHHHVMAASHDRRHAQEQLNLVYIMKKNTISKGKETMLLCLLLWLPSCDDVKPLWIQLTHQLELGIFPFQMTKIAKLQITILRFIVIFLSYWFIFAKRHWKTTKWYSREWHHLKRKNIVPSWAYNNMFMNGSKIIIMVLTLLCLSTL